MFREFLLFIKREKLFLPSQKILLAVSGGIDSAVMCELFYKAGFKFGIVHCNFNLRGQESDGDELFVREMAGRYDAEFHFEQFETKSYARKKRISIQMAARELRYTFFEAVQKKFKYDYVATAHHKGDVMETTLLNLTRGTGISGLHGILPKRESIIRPLLFASRKEIARFAADHRIPFREDSSNQSEKYKRNLVRKRIIPILKKINPDTENSFYESSLRVRDAEKLLLTFINEFIRKNVYTQGDATYIPIEAVAFPVGGETILFELLKPFGFTADAVMQIFQSSNGIPGKQFLSATHRLIRDRKNFIVIPLSEKSSQDSQQVKRVPAEVNFEKDTILFSVKDKSKFSVPKTSAVCCLDYAKLKFPLVVRPWREGDSFVPLGMKHHRKVSDFLIDKKVPLNEKRKVKVVESNNEIICLAGLRINDRYKVTGRTKKILVVQEAR